MADNPSLPPEPKLPPYDGQTVASTTISITNAGDGLSKGMAIEPQVLDLRSKRYVVLECTVDAHRHKSLPGTEMLTLEQVLKAGVATLVDADLVQVVVDEQRERIAKAEEAKKGISRLPYNDDGELGLAHARGEHADSLAEGCPVCDLERDTKLAEEEGKEPPKVAPIKGRRQRRLPAAE